MTKFPSPPLFPACLLALRLLLLLHVILAASLQPGEKGDLESWLRFAVESLVVSSLDKRASLNGHILL